MHTPDPFADIISMSDPFRPLMRWFDEAKAHPVLLPEAAQLATVDAAGMPNVRTVLVKKPSAEGCVFYTNFNSRKGVELLATRKAALLFYWRELGRQVRLRGGVAPVDDATADRYFEGRPRGSQIGAHASEQSAPLEARETFVHAIEDLASRFGDRPIPRPPHWSGFRLTPISIEFWQEGEHRLHDRVLFEKVEDTWRSTRLYP